MFSCAHQRNLRITPTPSNPTKYALKIIRTKTPLSRGVTGKTFTDTEKQKNEKYIKYIKLIFRLGLPYSQPSKKLRWSWITDNNKHRQSVQFWNNQLKGLNFFKDEQNCSCQLVECHSSSTQTHFYTICDFVIIILLKKCEIPWRNRNFHTFFSWPTTLFDQEQGRNFPISSAMYSSKNVLFQRKLKRQCLSMFFLL